MNEQYYIVLDLIISELDLFEYFQMFLKLYKLSKRYYQILDPKFDKLRIDITSDNMFSFWDDPNIQIYIHRFTYINKLSGLNSLFNVLSHKFRNLYNNVSNIYNINTDIFVNICLKLTKSYSEEKHSNIGSDIIENNTISFLTEDEKLELIAYGFVYEIFENYRIEYIYKHETTGIYNNCIAYYDIQLPSNYIQLCDITPGFNYETLFD